MKHVLEQICTKIRFRSTQSKRELSIKKKRVFHSVDLMIFIGILTNS